MSDQPNIRDVLNLMIELTDDDLLAAREEAKALVLKDIGEEPRPEQFMRRAAASGTPRWLTVTVGGVLAAAVVAAFLLSLFRVFTAGRDLFLEHMPGQDVQAAIAGIATFMLAELLVVGSVFTAQVYVTGWKRLPLYIAALLGIAMALTANVVVSKPDDWWSWLDTIAPPLAVLLISLAGEALLLDTLKKRATAYQEYSTAFEAWKRDTAQPEASLKFHNRYFPSAIKRALKRVNAAGTGAQRRKEIMASMPPEHWNVLVTRELKRADWFDADAGYRALQAAETQQPYSNGHGSDPRPLVNPPAPLEALATAN